MLPQYVTDFIDKYYPLAVAEAEKWGCDPLCILSQAAYESFYGKSWNAIHNNNFFGMCSRGGKGQLLPANEYWDGISETFAPATDTAPKPIGFKKYKTPLDSWMDHGMLIKSYYPEVEAAGMVLKDYAIAVSKSPYISITNGDDQEAYAKGIISIGEAVWPEYVKMQKSKVA